MWFREIVSYDRQQPVIRARENQSSRDSAASAIGPRLSRKEGRKRCNNPINNPKTKKVLFKFYPIYVFIYTQDLIHHCILNYAYVTMTSLGIFKSNIRQYRKFICRILQLPLKKYFEIIRATEIHDDSLCIATCQNIDTQLLIKFLKSHNWETFELFLQIQHFQAVLKLQVFKYDS